MELTEKQLLALRNIHSIQGDNGNWNYDPYMHGLYNGMEMMMAIIQGREPDFRKAPDQWLADIELPKDFKAETVQSDAD